MVSAHLQDDRGQQLSIAFQLARQNLRLLLAHALGGGPAQSQHKRRQSQLRHNLFERLTHRNLAVDDLIVRTDDPNPHIAHRYKVPCLLCVHRLGPLLRHFLGNFPGIRSVHISLRMIGHRKSQVSHPLKVLSDGLIDVQQDGGHKRQPR